MSDKPSKPADSLEPEAQPLYNGAPDRAIQLSQAISLKRLADSTIYTNNRRMDERERDR